MKKILSGIIVISIVTSISFGGDKFDARKSRVLEKVDKRIELLNVLKSCINSAKNGKDLKECRKKHRESIQSLKKKKS